MTNEGFVPKFFIMDPETETLFLTGGFLQNGMRVLMEASELRVDIPVDLGDPDMNEEDLERARKYNRWCVIRQLKPMTAADSHVRFVGVYDDGTMSTFGVGVHHGWYVKFDSIPSLNEKISSGEETALEYCKKNKIDLNEVVPNPRAANFGSAHFPSKKPTYDTIIDPHYTTLFQGRMEGVVGYLLSLTDTQIRDLRVVRGGTTPTQYVPAEEYLQKSRQLYLIARAAYEDKIDTNKLLPGLLTIPTSRENVEFAEKIDDAWAKTKQYIMNDPKVRDTTMEIVNPVVDETYDRLKPINEDYVDPKKLI